MHGGSLEITSAASPFRKILKVFLSIYQNAFKKDFLNFYSLSLSKETLFKISQLDFLLKLHEPTFIIYCYR